MFIYSGRFGDLRELLYGNDCKQSFKYGFKLQNQIPLIYLTLGEKYTIRLMKYFPNVEEITIKHTHYRKYLEVLLKMKLEKAKKIKATQTIHF